MTKFMVSLMVLAGLTGAFKVYHERFATPASVQLPLAVQFVQGPEIRANQPVLIEEWATWCGPCRQSIPHLNTLKEQYGGRGLQVVGITRESEATIVGFMRQLPMQYSVASDPTNRYGRELGVSSIPHAFLLNSNGKIVWHGHPMQLPESAIEGVLGK